MYPTLFKIGSVTIHTYGLMIAIGFLVCLGVAKILSKRSGIDAERMVDMGFWVLLVGFIGARVLFAITQWDEFVKDPMMFFRVWEGGFVFYGGILAAGPFGVWWVKRYNIDPWKGADVTFPCVTIAHAFGRLGCFGAGCCYGVPTFSDWGLKFHSELVDSHMRGIALHPTQLYSAFSLFVLFGFMMWMFKRKAFDGQIALIYLIGYPIIRSIIEVYRGDKIRGFLIEDVLSTSQFISILVAAFAGLILVIRLKQLKKKSA